MTLIVGDIDNVIFSMLKVLGMRQGSGIVHIKPQITSVRPSAPTRSRKYHRVAMEFGFDSACFQQPQNIKAFINGTYSVYFGFQPEDLTPETIDLGQKTEASHLRLLNDHPELKELWEDFLPKWKEAYARALAETTDAGDKQ